ncbi:MAG: SAM-dependent methyltransferase [Micromonosporaceae bacterium]
MEPPDSTPVEVDLNRPNAARVYDYYLGGSHNFAADREMAKQAIDMWPDLPVIIQANRAFLRRAVKHLVASGVRQFLDLGSGIPTVGNVHEVARAGAEDASVVYVDIDSVAVAHSQALLADTPGVGVVEADLRHPEQVLRDPKVAEILDLGQPVAMMMVAVLHFVPDADDPAGVIAAYRDALAPGSWLAISHASNDGQGAVADDHQRLYQRTATPMTMRSHEQISQMLSGWELVEPGLARMPLWRPDAADPTTVRDPDQVPGYAAVGRKA